MAGCQPRCASQSRQENPRKKGVGVSGSPTKAAPNREAIASHLGISTDDIIEVQEWAIVLWVRFKGGCRFVSKKVGMSVTPTATVTARVTTATAVAAPKNQIVALKPRPVVRQ